MAEITKEAIIEQVAAFRAHYIGRFAATEGTGIVNPFKNKTVGLNTQPIMRAKIGTMEWKYFLVTIEETKTFDLLLGPGDIIRISEKEDLVCPEAVLRIMQAISEETEAEDGEQNGG